MRLLRCFVILGSLLLVAIGSAVAQVVEQKKPDVLICREDKYPCTVDSPCSGPFTYCATVEQCGNAQRKAQGERACLDGRPPGPPCCERFAGRPGRYSRGPTR